MKKYRIITNGETYRIQRKVFWLFWDTLCNGWTGEPYEYTLFEAQNILKRWTQDDNKRELPWREIDAN